MSTPSFMDWSWSSSDNRRDKERDVSDVPFEKIKDRYNSREMNSLLVRSGWYNRWGDMAKPEEEEVLSVEDESDNSYAKAYEAFKQGQNMPSRLRRSEHALQDIPFEMKKAGIELRSAQLEGAGLLCWLEKMYYLGILADDMGVGKTFQLMALVFQNQLFGADETTLLVVPAGAMTMWKANMERFPDISYVEYNTYNKDHLDVKDLVSKDVVLTTYNLIAQQYSNYAERESDIKAAIQGKTSQHIRVSKGSCVNKQLDIQRPWAPLYGMAFHRVILDESHGIRNVRSGQFKAMLKLDTQRSIACSGTMFNDDYTDVGAILTFLRYQPWCNPSPFARYFLKAKRKKAGSGGGARRAQLKHLRGAVFKYTLDGISVRKNKRDKFEEKQIIGIEKLDYHKVEHSLDVRFGTFIIDRRPCTEQDTQKNTTELWSRHCSSEEEENEDEPMEKYKLGSIPYARLACISHLCPDASYSNRGLELEMQLDIELDRYDYYGDERNIQRVKDASAFEKSRNRVRKEARTGWAESTRLQEAMSLIKEHLEQNVDLMAPAKPHKIVVYCEFLSALDVLEVGIQQEIPEKPILRINGQSSGKSRDKALKMFLQDPEHCIVLVTFNAGSEAIDLSSAHYVIPLHPTWNPVQIQQCIGRAYRHGQERQVMARVLVAKSSIETYVYKVQDQKRKKDLLLKTSCEREEDGAAWVRSRRARVCREGRAQSRITAGASQATRNPDLDGNDTPRSGMQSEVEIVQNAGQVPPDDDSSSSGGDSGDDDTKIQTDVVEE